MAAPVRIGRPHKALVKSVGGKPPKASPTFRLLGSRKAQDGQTWDEHYKRASAKVAQEIDAQTVGIIYREILKDPQFKELMYQRTGLAPDQYARALMRNPQEGQQFLRAYEDFTGGRVDLAPVAEALVGTRPGLNTVDSRVADTASLATDAASLPMMLLPGRAGQLGTAATQFAGMGAQIGAGHSVESAQMATVTPYVLAQLQREQLGRQALDRPELAPEVAKLDAQIRELAPAERQAPGMGEAALRGGARAVGNFVGDVWSPRMSRGWAYGLPGVMGAARAVGGDNMSERAQGGAQLLGELGRVYTAREQAAKALLPGLNRADRALALKAQGLDVRAGKAGLNRGLRVAGRVAGRASTIAGGPMGLYDAIHGSTEEGQDILDYQVKEKALLDSKRGPLGRLAARLGSLPGAVFDPSHLRAYSTLDELRTIGADSEVKDYVGAHQQADDRAKEVADTQNQLLEWLSPPEPSAQYSYRDMGRLARAVVERRQQLRTAQERRANDPDGRFIDTPGGPAFDPEDDVEQINQLLEVMQAEGSMPKLSPAVRAQAEQLARVAGAPAVAQYMFRPVEYLGETTDRYAPEPWALKALESASRQPMPTHIMGDIPVRPRKPEVTPPPAKPQTKWPTPTASHFQLGQTQAQSQRLGKELLASQAQRGQAQAKDLVVGDRQAQEARAVRRADTDQLLKSVSPPEPKPLVQPPPIPQNLPKVPVV